MRHATLYFAVCGIATVCLYGCASAKKADTIDILAGGTTTQPVPPVPITVDASQITAQVVAQAKQEWKADVQTSIDAAISAQGLGNYTSEFGVGAASVVILTALIAWRSVRAAGRESAATVKISLEMVAHVVDVLKLALTLSSEREIKRIETSPPRTTPPDAP